MNLNWPRIAGTLAIALTCTFTASMHAADSPPSILTQPRSQSVSLGADVTFRVVFSGSPPITFQWQHSTTNVLGATNSTLILTNVGLLHSGAYAVILSNSFGSATSQIATLSVDPAFTKITMGAIATDGGDSSGCAWGDFNNDDFPDLFVGNGGTRNFLYRNNGDGTFTKLTDAAPARDSGYGGSWGDFDNDGWFDLFVSNLGATYLYRNNRNGSFTKITPFAGATGANSWSGSWGDFDRDGWIDLFISNGAGNNNVLLRNNGDGSFTRIALGRIVRDGGVSIGAAWQDYDRDGWPDLFVANNGANNFLYHNIGAGTLERVTTGRIATDSQSAIVPDWGDYDNDGWPDLAVGAFGRNLLFRNLGNGTFAKQTNGPVVLDAQNSEIVQWADYDNDGFLDLFSANNGGQNNTLYHNNGDGTFAKIRTGSIVNDGGNSAGCAWADYDNDGFLDLFVANWQGSRPNFLYRNNSTSNHWLKVKCVGTVSNRAGIGAKVRVKATLRSKESWQLREISGGTGFGQTPSLAHFGLGDAKLAGTVRIEWPSGAIQEVHHVAADKLLTVIEPPKLDSAIIQDGSFAMSIVGLSGAVYWIETSSDLVGWTDLISVTNSNGRAMVRPPTASSSQRFYRLRDFKHE
jgi:enediyne biosynthesis protein E4